MSTDKKGSRILARTFFTQLRASGYSPTEVIGIATELLDLVTEDIKNDSEKAIALQVTPEARPELRQEA